MLDRQSYTVGSYCSVSPSSIASPGSHTWCGASGAARSVSGGGGTGATLLPQLLLL